MIFCLLILLCHYETALGVIWMNRWQGSCIWLVSGNRSVAFISWYRLYSSIFSTGCHWTNIVIRIRIGNGILGFVIEVEGVDFVGYHIPTNSPLSVSISNDLLLRLLSIFQYIENKYIDISKNSVTQSDQEWDMVLRGWGGTSWCRRRGYASTWCQRNNNGSGNYWQHHNDNHNWYYGHYIKQNKVWG